MNAEGPPRILVTGANGFAGRHLLAALTPRPPLPNAGEGAVRAALLFAAVRPERLVAEQQSGPLPSASEIVGMDAGDAERTGTLLECIRPHQIYHLAARASGADADREAVFAVNVSGTRQLLEAAARLSPPPRTLIISTGYVYGETDPAHPAREETPTSPPGRYGAYTDSKIAMEAVASVYREFVIVARAFAHTGPGQSSAFAIPAFARQLARIEQGLEPPELRVGNLDAQRDLLHVRDVVRAYRLLMEHGAPGEVYNVATGQPVSMRMVLDQLRGLSSAAARVTVDPARLRPAEIACSTGDAARLRTRTGWTPQFALETTLRDTLNYWRAVARNTE